MSNNIQNWREMGIDDDDLFTPKGLPYWKTLDNPDLFIAALMHELSGEKNVIRHSIEILQTSKKLSEIQFSETLNAKQLCDVMLKSTEKLEQTVLLMLHYNHQDNTTD